MKTEEILRYFETDFDQTLTQWAKKGNADYCWHWVIWYNFLPREITMWHKLEIVNTKDFAKSAKKILKKHNAHLVRRNTTHGIWFDDGTDDHPKYVRLENRFRKERTL